MSTKMALIFPGQGAQEKNMGRDLAEAHKGCMELWKAAEKYSHLPLREIYFESQDEKLMADTQYLQPALTVVNLSLWMVLSAKFKPACTAGHSLGEFSALAAAQVLSFSEVLELVSLRGRLMAEADPEGRGGMCAVIKLDRDSVEEIAKVVRGQGELLLVANYNTPEQFVLSGTKEAIALAAPLVKERKGRLLPLAVSGAFHSPLMQSAAKSFSQAVDRYTWQKPKFGVYSNVTGQVITDGDSLRELCKQQMISSVLWVDTVQNQYQAGIKTWVELGPKAVLGKMVNSILVQQEDVQVKHVASLEGVNAL